MRVQSVVPGVFIVYEHRLFNDILSKVLGGETVIGAVERAATPLSAIVEAINSAHPDVVLIESDANGNIAWHIVLASGEVSRVLVLDIDKGLIRDYEARTSAIDTMEELLVIMGIK